MTAWSRAARLTVAAALLAPATRADDAPRPAIEEAREHAMRGAELFREKDYRGALVEYRRANELAPNFRVEYNIGLSCFELQEWACALSAFERYLQDGGSDVSPERAQTVASDIAQLRRRIAWLRIVVDEDGADVAVDDIVVGKSPLPRPVAVTAGQRRVTATLAPNPPITKVLEVVGGENADVVFRLHPSPRAPGSAPAAASHAADTDAPRAPRSAAQAPQSKLPFVVSASTTGALAAAGAVTGAMALGAKSDLHATLGRYGVSSSDVTAARSKATTLAAVTDVLFASALVAAGISTYFFFSTVAHPAAPEAAPASVSLGIGPGAVELTGRF